MHYLLNDTDTSSNQYVVWVTPTRCFTDTTADISFFSVKYVILNMSPVIECVYR